MAGGVALNCVTNHRLLAATPFDGLWVQPAANDAGTSLGAAAWVWNVILADPSRFDTRNVINRKVKRRESFRPFAPSLLAEEVPALFETLPDKQEHTREFMLSALCAT